jgi:phenylpyruvate tautomerase PptA (4-oxalocrotonate tautomerase family)
VIRLPRTIRLDASDTVVFAHAAEPGEWAVPGTFLFAGRPASSLSRKEAVAFRSGFLGVESFGHSTLVTVTEATSEERAAMVSRLAEQLVAHLGAPDVATARPAAEEEVALAEDLCRGHAINTLIALHRREEEGTIREQFRTLKPRDETAFSAGFLRGHDRAFHIVEEDEEDEAVDILNLRGTKR